MRLVLFALQTFIRSQPGFERARVLNLIPAGRRGLQASHTLTLPTPAPLDSPSPRC